jgi:HlyD family secretion protein
MRFLKRLFIFVAFGLVLAAGIYYFPFETAAAEEKMPVAKTEYKSFDVDVKSVGELEAARSTIIASSVKGDIGKIIYLIADGTNVQPGELLVKMDPTPFEEKVEKLKSQLKEQATLVHTLEKTLEWEINQAEHEIKTAAFETETAELELSKIVNGDGPLEISRLRAAMQKAWLKYDELNAYSND